MAISHSRHFWGINLLTLPISSYVTEGIAKIGGFEVLRHGTSFPNYLNILRHGADPAYGGRTSNEAAFDEDTRRQGAACTNRFYVFKDSEAFLNDGQVNIKVPIVGHIIKRTHTRLHAVLAGAALVKNTQNKVLRITKKIFYGFPNFFCPTLRFVYKKQEMQIFNSEKDFKGQETNRQAGLTRFISDEDYGNLAYKTPDALPNDRIGLIGLLKHISWNDIKQTFKKNPDQFLLGSIQIITGIALTTLGIGILL